MKYAYAIIGILAVVIFWHLGLRPLEYDEGVNFWFITHFREYQYNPANFHGPWLYYPQVLISGYGGVSPYVLRIGTALAGVLVLCGVAWSTYEWGIWPMITSLLLCGLSCDFLYYSRYFIHEIWFVLFSLGIYLGIQKKNIYLLVLSAALAFCTKETSILTFGIVGVSALILKERIPLRGLRWAIAAGLFVIITLYTNMFTHAHGIADMVRGPFAWLSSVHSRGSVQPFWYYLKMLSVYEFSILFCSIIGAYFAMLHRDKHISLVLGWVLGNLLIYSLIPYKMPWLILNMVVPMAILGGYGVASLDGMQYAFPLLLLALTPYSLVMNYRYYDNPNYPQNYAQTNRDINRMMIDIGPDRGIVKVILKDYWPLPYYLRNFKFVEFMDVGITENPASVIIADVNYRENLKYLLDNGISRKTYNVRPLVDVDVYKKGI